jgi:hypothetical protein
MWTLSRQYSTGQEFEIVFRWQWEVELRPVLRQVDVWNTYCKVIKVM